MSLNTYQSKANNYVLKNKDATRFFNVYFKYAVYSHYNLIGPSKVQPIFGINLLSSFFLPRTLPQNPRGGYRRDPTF